MPSTDIHLSLIEKEKYVYANAELFEQFRRSPDSFIHLLQSPGKAESHFLLNECNLRDDLNNLNFSVQNNVVDFTSLNQMETSWQSLNEQFLNYHKSLTAHTLLNEMPILNYISLHSKVGFKKNIRVLDIGGGTGHAFCSFFQFPEEIEYFLVDPNLRLLHDHFLRIYPKLTYLKIAHLRAYAERLPFKDEIADLVFSNQAIDHLENHEAFIRESYRVLKSGGELFIASHFDSPFAYQPADKSNWYSIFERCCLYFHHKQNCVKKDDHTMHIKNTKDLEETLNSTGFSIKKRHTFSRYFYLVASKE